jgi:hypothetical protein
LPIGIGDEADRGVESEQRFYCREIQGIDRQLFLENEDQVNDDRHYQIGGQHVEGVGLPIHRHGRGAPADQQVDRVVGSNSESKRFPRSMTAAAR